MLDEETRRKPKSKWWGNESIEEYRHFTRHLSGEIREIDYVSSYSQQDIEYQ